jgi:uncharacterized protein
MRARALVLTIAVASWTGVSARAQASHVSADSAKHVAIRRLLTLQKTDSLMLAGIEQAFGEQQQTPEMPAGFLDSLRSRIRQNIPQFVERIVPIYDSLYTADEIQQLTTFYKSPIGQRYVATQPHLLEAMQGLGQRWGMELAGQVMVDLSRQPVKRP